jgi:hypothetical protein
VARERSAALKPLLESASFDANAVGKRASECGIHRPSAPLAEQYLKQHTCLAAAAAAGTMRRRTPLITGCRKRHRNRFAEPVSHGSAPVARSRRARRAAPMP